MKISEYRYNDYMKAATENPTEENLRSGPSPAGKSFKEGKRTRDSDTLESVCF